MKKCGCGVCFHCVKGRMMKKSKEYYDNESIFLSELRERLKKSGNISFPCSRKNERGEKEFGVRLVNDPFNPDNPVLWIREVKNMYKSMFDDRLDPESMKALCIKIISEEEKRTDATICSLKEKPYEEIKGFITPRFLAPWAYESFLAKVPYRKYLDFAIVYCYFNKEVSVTVTNDWIDRSGVTEDVIFDDSIKNIIPRDAVSINEFADENRIGILNNEDDTKESFPMFVLTNEEGLFGANVILRNDHLENVSKSIGDFYVLPSTNQLVTVVPVKDLHLKWSSVEELRQFNLWQHVRGVDGVSPEEYYSARIYVYHQGSCKLEIVE